jgi:flavin-dependent dehydrogenase
MTAPSRTVDQLVIGGGPAGAMAAIKLAEAGRQVMLVEKESRPHHKVCGEFLSREAIEYLHGISIFPSELGAAPVRLVRLSSGSRVAESALPFDSLSLSRRALDAAMLARAEAAGCQVQRGAAVVRLTAHQGGWLVHLATGECIAAQTVFLASGKHDLHGWNRPRGTQGDLVGFKLHWRLSPAQTAAMRASTDLFLFRGGYGGLILIENEAANFCLVVKHSVLRRHGGWPALLAAIIAENAHLRRRLSGADALQSRPLAISSIPYGYLRAQACGLWRIGDQAAVIPSFTGDGISIALHSASLAADMCLRGRNVEEYTRTLRGQLRMSMRLATWLSRGAVSAAGRTIAPSLFSAIPPMMGWIAAATRVPADALLCSRDALSGAAGALFAAGPSPSRDPGKA